MPLDVLGPLNEVEQINAPAQLFVAGDATLLRHYPRVAVVGSRKASDEGLRRAAKLARVLVQHDVVVVSGLARGIDTAAHVSAIENDGRTIGVIGTSLDRVYPAESAELQGTIARHHLVVSQFPPGSPTKPGNFPRRNRTMALIVHAGVIVEAGDTSGTLSLGWEALRLGRPLFIVKSVVESPKLRWPQTMLQYGAQVLNDPEQLLDALPYGEPRADFSLSA